MNDEGGWTFDTETPLGGQSSWVPGNWMQPHLKSERRREALQQQLNPITDKFFSVLSGAAMCGQSSEKLLAAIEADLDAYADKVLEALLRHTQPPPI